jgi:GAF domain-containing protein
LPPKPPLSSPLPINPSLLLLPPSPKAIFSHRAWPAGPLEFYTLAIAFNSLTSRLQQTLAGLEQRVAERTQDLAHRTQLIEAAAEVGRAAASILDTNQLFQQVVDLIRTHFDLYYVGLFTLDETAEWAILRAGTGEAGKIMLARGHRIKVGQGMIGWSIANARSRVAGEAGADAVRLASAELPNTRAEAALPLISRNRVLGALTVQSERSGTFDPSTVTVLQTMADQVAVALDNARLFAESQQAFDALRRSYGELSRAAWVEALRTRPIRGYFSDERGIYPVHQAEALGTSPAELISPAPSEQTAIALPLKVREQTLGLVSAQKSDDSEAWTEEEATLLASLVDQLSVALENARLYEDTQRLAERQRLAAEVSARIRESLDVDTVLQTAVSEMRRAIGLEEIIIRLGDTHEQQ